MCCCCCFFITTVVGVCCVFCLIDVVFTILSTKRVVDCCLVKFHDKNAFKLWIYFVNGARCLLMLFACLYLCICGIMFHIGMGIFFYIRNARFFFVSFSSFLLYLQSTMKAKSCRINQFQRKISKDFSIAYFSYMLYNLFFASNFTFSRLQTFKLLIQVEIFWRKKMHFHSPCSLFSLQWKYAS